MLRGAPRVGGAENLAASQLLERVGVLGEQLVPQNDQLGVVRAYFRRLCSDHIFLVQVDLRVLFLKIQEEVLQEPLVLHEQVESV